MTDNPNRISNVRTEIRRDKSENSINNENEKNKTESGEKNVDGSRAHVLEPIECTEMDRIRRVFLWHTEDIQALLFAHSMCVKSRSEITNSHALPLANMRYLSNAQRPLSIQATAVGAKCTAIGVWCLVLGVFTYSHCFHAPFVVGWLVRFMFVSLERSAFSCTKPIDSMFYFT